jgi:uncharacterized Zn-binding protein involved in type VI secretion
MPKICREEDSLSTGHPCTINSTLDTPSQSTVFVEGKLVARVGDKTVEHTQKTGTDSNGDNICTNHTGSISVGSLNVFVEGKAVARVGDAVDAGSMTSGASDVSVN